MRSIISFKGFLMLIDTHCHMNIMLKKNFEQRLTQAEINAAHEIIIDAQAHDVTTIVNVGTSLIESENCVMLARHYASLFATVGIHPNDCTQTWRDDFKKIEALTKNKEINKIVGIGECGIDLHYPDSNLSRQYDAFKAHIELALEHDLALVIHSRDAYDETLRALEEFKKDIKRATVHCFSYDQTFADYAVENNFVIGIDGPITYPKNDTLRNVVKETRLENIILETDAPFLPPQSIRGKQNHPLHIKTIAQAVADVKGISYEEVARQTTANAKGLFKLS